MRTSVADVFAAGDVCTASWTHSPYWLQVTIGLIMMITIIIILFYFLIL